MAQKRNVLDLRQIHQQRQEHNRRRSFSRAARQAQDSLPDWHIEWRRFGREAAKYGLGLAIGGLVVTLVWMLLTSLRGLQQTTATAKRGIESIERGVLALNERRQVIAAKSFDQASQELGLARQQLRAIVPGGSGVAKLLPYVGPRYAAADQLLQAASTAAEAGKTASLVSAESDVPMGLTIENTGIIRGNLGWLAVLATDSERLNQVAAKLLQSYRLVEGVQIGVVPKSLRSELEAWQKIGRGLFGSPERLEQVVQVLLGVSTQAGEQDYLVLFQNSDELRPTGGFVGSYAMVKFQRGRFAITDAPGNGPYALKDVLPQTIRPPVPLDEITPAMAFQDGNWYLDAPSSAAIMMELYRQARGFTPDGVLFLTPDLLEFLLTVTGPVTIEESGLTVTAASLVETLEVEAELNYDRSLNAPKRIIIQLLPAILNKIKALSLPDALRALTILVNEADRGNILLVSSSPEVMQASDHLGWSGRVAPADTNIFSLVSTNIGGGKTDRQMETATELRVRPRPGDWEHVVTIRRKHNGHPDRVLRNSTNYSYLRLVVPPGANLISIDGASVPPEDMFISPNRETKPLALITEPAGITLSDPIRRTVISHENGGTTFGFWSAIEPGQEQTITVRYTVPEAEMMTNNQFQLTWLRQPGSVHQRWRLVIDPEQARFKPEAPIQGWEQSQRTWSWSGNGEFSARISGSMRLKSR